MLTHTLIDFLMGETDGVPKDPNYIFRLYMALGNYPQAAKTAIIIARQEQELGNYRVAHQILLDTHKELTLQKIRVPQVPLPPPSPSRPSSSSHPPVLLLLLLLSHPHSLSLVLCAGPHRHGPLLVLAHLVPTPPTSPPLFWQELAHNLMLLHSYVLVKTLVKAEDHLSGARMLVRVARNISKFPVHKVQILTSTVIECHRAGLRGSAFEHASTLVQPENRSQLQEQFKRKIEAIVRKAGDRTNLEEPETPSPFDPNAMVAETALECPSTRNTIPYCVATGRHVVLHDLTLCPSCGTHKVASLGGVISGRDGLLRRCV